MKCADKTAYASEDEARKVGRLKQLNAGFKLFWYSCWECGKFHLTKHPRFMGAPLKPVSEDTALSLALNDAKVAKNRALSPEFTAFVDEVRKYAPGAKVTFFTDGKITLGRPKPRGVQVSEPAYVKGEKR